MTTAEIVAYCGRDPIEGEPLWDAIQRRIVEAVVAELGSANAASKLLGCSRQTVLREIHRAEERRVNARLGHPELNRTQRGGMSDLRLQALARGHEGKRAAFDQRVLRALP